MHPAMLQHHGHDLDRVQPLTEQSPTAIAVNAGEPYANTVATAAPLSATDTVHSELKMDRTKPYTNKNHR